ncbi:MAG TPA: RNA-binding protein [Gammaproteobacteria bacterium]|nr:RNA-binding protein [Gammaproteobacteria bacterium]|tara:strand:- start:4408 stop:4815 length:408 start_codon:yes stop_codon:yes gene_type:complete
MTESSNSESTTTRLRIDKWLWAARFFKTRAVAKQAIEGGKIHCDGSRVKASKEIGIGTIIQLRQGLDEKIVEVLVLSDKRRGAPEAQSLYQETPASIVAREALAQQRKSQPNQWASEGKPNKKQRRDIHRFKTKN